MSSNSTSKDDWLGSAPTISDKNTHEVSWTVFFTVATYLIAIFFLSPNWIANEIDNEIKDAYKWTGEESAKKLKENSYNIYQTYIIDSGVQKMIKKSTSIDLKSSSSKNDFVKKVEKIISDTGEATLLIIFQSIYRAQTVLFWIPLFVPFLVAFLIEGLTVRKLKQFTFGWASANTFHLMKRAIIGVIPVLIVLYFSFPLSIPVIMPLFILIFLGISTNILISNMQKIF